MTTKIAKILTEAAQLYQTRALIGLKPNKTSLIPSYYTTPVSTVFPIYLLPGGRIQSILGLVPELRMHLRQRMKTSSTMTFVPDPPAIELMSLDPTILDLTTGYLQRLKVNQSIVGINFYSSPPEAVGINFADPDCAHTLICGSTGSGKTSAMQDLILSLAYGASPQQIEMYFIDLKRRGLFQLGKLPHVRASTSDPIEASHIVRYVRRLVEDRKKSELTSPSIYLVVDEIAEFADCGIGDVFEKHFPTIARLGREFGVHLIIAAQKPEATQLGGQFLQQFNVRLTGRLKDSHQASQILGRGDTGAHLLSGKGSMLCLKGGDDVIKFQAFLCRDLGSMIGGIQQKWSSCPSSDYIDFEVETFVEEPSGGKPSKYNHAGDAEILRPIFSQWYDFETMNMKRGGYTKLAQALGTVDGGSGRVRVVEAIRILLDELDSETN
jgi:hypothetical protein